MLTNQEYDRLSEYNQISGNKIRLSEFVRRIALGEFLHPNIELEKPQDLNVRDTGRLVGSYEYRVYYQAAVLAAQYLKIMHDPDYKRIIQANKDDFEAIIKDIRGCLLYTSPSPRDRG